MAKTEKTGGDIFRNIVRNFKDDSGDYQSRLVVSFDIVAREAAGRKVYVWYVDKNKDIVPAYPLKKINKGDFEMWEDTVLAFLNGYDNDRYHIEDKEGDIEGKKIYDTEGNLVAVVMIEHLSRASFLRPVNDTRILISDDEVFTLMSDAISIFLEKNRIDKCLACANSLGLPNRTVLVEKMENEGPYTLCVEVGMKAPAEVLNQYGYILTEKLLGEWVRYINGLSGLNADLYYKGESCFYIAYSGAAEEVLGVLNELPRRLSEIRANRVYKGKTETATAKAEVKVAFIDGKTERFDKYLIRLENAESAADGFVILSETAV